MIQLHALSASALLAADLSEDAGRPVDTVACGRLHGVVTLDREAPREPDRAELLAHGRVVEAVSRRVPALPVRYGVFHRGLDTLRQAVLAREAEFLRTLERVGGRVEFVVRAPVPFSAPSEDRGRGGASDEPKEGPHRGRAYMKGRLAAERARAAEREEAEGRLVGLVRPLEARAVKVRARNRGRGAERVFLVAREDAAEFAAEAALLGQEFVVGGPWPPFTFAAEEGP